MLSIIIPIYNEEKVIRSTVVNLITEGKNRKIDTQFVLVNNNSSDGTSKVLTELYSEFKNIVIVNTPPVIGYGVAVRWGIYFATHRYVLITMADASESPNDVYNLFATTKNGNYDFGFGSRFCKDAKILGYPKIKFFFNRVGNWLIRYITGINYNDFTNGFKCFSRSKLEQMQPLIAREFNLTVEMTIKAISISDNFCVIPTSWKERKKGKSKFKIYKQSMLYLSTINYCLKEKFVQKILTLSL